MSRKDRIEHVISLGPSSLRHLVGGSLEGNKDDPREELFEAGVLLVREPWVTA
jgi:hypothetical protein